MPMVVTDPRQADNPIVFANRAFLDLTLYKEEEVIGRNCRMLQGPDTNPDTVREIRAALAEHRACALDILNYKADGAPFWNGLYIGPIFDHDGELLYFFASQIDITQRRSSEETSLQAQKMEAIGQLTAGMAHDFNNLLQVINGNLELALLALDPAHRAAEPIRRAQRAAMKAGKLTQQLLTFARKQRLEPRRVNLNALLVEFSDMLVRTLGDRVELHLDLKPGLPWCTLDPTHLEMAVLNVVINARDAMPAGGQVRMIFPVDGVREGRRTPDGGAAVGTAPEGDDGAKPRILVVEDNEDVRELAESMLGEAGYAVLSAPSGERALALFDDGDGIDLVFTDVMMPGGMNGVQLADQVRRRRPDTPILVTTGYTDALPAAPQALQLDILGKPYRQEELLSRVRAMLPRPR